MLRHAFLIMAHKDWHTLKCLMSLLDAEWSDIYLHIDRKAKDFDQSDFKTICRKSNVFFVQRHNVTWGNESQVKAEMTLFKESFKHGPYWYYHFLSGSDLPIKPLNYIYNFFEQRQYNFLTTENDISKYEWRLQTYIKIFRQNWLPASMRKRMNIFSEIIQYKFHINRLKWLRKHYPIIGKGHNWCDLTDKAVEVLIKSARDIRRFCRFTHCSDEMYKQIVLFNQPVAKTGPFSPFDIKMIEWEDDSDHPRTFQMNDFDNLVDVSNPYLFARKFDSDVDPRVVDRLTNYLIGERNGRE